MPSTSRSQQRAAGMALAVKRGEIPASHAKGAVKHMATSMSQAQLKEFTTRRKG